MMGLCGDISGANIRVIDAQLRSSQDVVLLRRFMSLCGLLFIWQVFGNAALALPLSLWSAMLIGSIAFGVHIDSQMRRVPPGGLTLRHMRRHALGGLLHGVIWATALILLSYHSDGDALVSLWTLMSCIMVCGAISYAPTPLAAFAFLSPCIAGLVLMFNDSWNVPLRALSISYALALLVGCIIHARTFARHHSATTQLEEKSEVVSLLLREYEDGGSDWLWQTDPLRRLSSVSRRFAETLGVEPAAIEGMPLVQLLAGPAWENGRFASGLHALADHLKRRESFSNVVLPVEIAERTCWWELSASPRHDENGVFLGFRGVGSDVTAQREAADKIEQLARFDPLTGLPNRAHLREVLDRSMTAMGRRAPGCAFLMLDLDRFKAVNDTLGHQTGDKLLTQVARRLRQICSGQEFCGRIGGDEFAVVIPRIAGADHVARLADAVIESLSAPYQVDEHTLYVGASVGSAVSPGDGHESEELIRSADLALYQSKGEGGGLHYAYEPQLHAQAEERRLIELALREALEKEELHLLYQPVVDVATGTLLGFEALARWTHPDMGPISPAKFVPVAEEARLIAPIGEWVLRTACLEAARWPEPLRIAVNVSADQLTHSSFVAAVISALAQSGLDASRLELEVTESIFMNEDAGGLRVLEQLRGLGVRLSLDDFGTGYSSLGYLSRIRFDTIKIDRSFVVGASKNVSENLAIIRAVVTLADSLGITTTAEGVETEAELDMIRRLGCQKVQGYYFGRPMAARDAVKLFPASGNRISA